MRPYFYKIQEITTGRYYVGCQYGKNADPINFWVNYYTSCRYILAQDKNNFRVLCVSQREDAKDYERKYLRRMYKFLGAQRFQEVFINRNLAPGILFTEEVRNKMSVGIKKSADARKRSGSYVPSFSGKEHSEETKRKISKTRSDYFSNGGIHPRGMLGKHHSDDVKQRISDSGKRNSALCGKTGEEHPTGNTTWYNNGVSHIRSDKHPGDGWVAGRIFKQRKPRNSTVS